MITILSHKGKECPYRLARPTPNICQHETGYCHDCQIYLDSITQRHLQERGSNAEPKSDCFLFDRIKPTLEQFKEE